MALIKDLPSIFYEAGVKYGIGIDSGSTMAKGALIGYRWLRRQETMCGR